MEGLMKSKEPFRFSTQVSIPELTGLKAAKLKIEITVKDNDVEKIVDTIVPPACRRRCRKSMGA